MTILDSIQLPRFEQILFKLAQQRAKHLTPPGWNQTGDPLQRLQTLARRLASFNLLLLVGEVPTDAGQLRELHINDWTQGYGQFYHLLAGVLFPSFNNVNAYYADEADPPAIVMNGDSTPIMVAFAGYVAPYMAARQPHHQAVSDNELIRLIDFLITELEGNDLPANALAHLRVTGVQVLRQMLRSSIRHLSLTAFYRPILDMLQTPRPPPGLPR